MWDSSILGGTWATSRLAIVRAWAHTYTMIKKVTRADVDLLDAYVKGGHVWIDGNEVVGLASDGTVVSLGSIFSGSTIASYLRANPTPHQW